MKTSTKVESALKIKLPKAYKELLDNPPPLKDKDVFYDYFIIDPKVLIENNSSYNMTAEEVENINDEGFLGNIKRFLLYGSKNKIIERRKNYHKEWAGKYRYIIGNDGGDEYYYIYLNNPKCQVFTYELETKKTYQKFDSLKEYVFFLDSVYDKEDT